MVPEMEKPQVTEITVRMDCNGCVQKIKKALQVVSGIQGIDVDFPQQKLTITGWAEPEKLVKAIRKTRKAAVICVHTEETGPVEGEEAASPQQEPMNQQGETEAAPQDEPPPLQPENPPAYHQQTRPNGAEVHVVYHHPPDHGYGRPWNAYPGFGDESHQPPPQVYVQSYNTYRPSPHVTEYEYPRPPPPRYSYDTRPNPYSDPPFKEEPPQPQPQPQPPQPQPLQQPQPQPQPSPPATYIYNARPYQYSGPGFRDEPPQPQQPLQQQLPQPVCATHSYNTYKPSPYVTGYAYPRSPPRPSPSTHIRPDSSWGPGLQGESEQSQPPQPVYATHSQNIYRPSPYVTEYAYPKSPPPRYSSFSIPGNYSRDYYGGSHGNGNVTSMFSEENANACRIV
ncbi:leucine-rich repeat extensin-like protein 3 [Salvia splendens]|uniref:leucine-rich repeat extensin-like protein 3 n=1 Tax=Salvia splendens TaxID=180675 RepID=UPI001C25D84B|nr:leucine-rich repeat extensin-like protein 3 [Salvia splendens]